MNLTLSSHIDNLIKWTFNYKIIGLKHSGKEKPPPT